MNVSVLTNCCARLEYMSGIKILNLALICCRLICCQGVRLSYIQFCFCDLCVDLFVILSAPCNIYFVILFFRLFTVFIFFRSLLF